MADAFDQLVALAGGAEGAVKRADTAGEEAARGFQLFPAVQLAQPRAAPTNGQHFDLFPPVQSAQQPGGSASNIAVLADRMMQADRAIRGGGVPRVEPTPAPPPIDTATPEEFDIRFAGIPFEQEAGLPQPTTQQLPPTAELAEQTAVLRKIGETSAELEARRSQEWNVPNADRLAVLNEKRRLQNLEPVAALPGPMGAADVAGQQFGTAYGLARKAPFVGTLTEAGYLWQVYNAAKAAEKGSATLDDWKVLADYQEELLTATRDKTLWGNVTNILAEYGTFALEFGLSGGIASFLRKGAKKAGEEVAEGVISGGLRKLAREAASRSVGTKAVQGAIVAAVRAPAAIARASLPDYTLSAADEAAVNFLVTTPSAPLLQAIGSGLTSSSIEVVSEFSGGPLAKMFKIGGRAAAKAGQAVIPRAIQVPVEKLAEFTAAAKTRLATALMQRFPKKYRTVSDVVQVLAGAGYNSIWELGEERVAEVMQAAAHEVEQAAGLQETIHAPGIPSWKQVLTEAMAFAVPSVGAVGVGVLAGGREQGGTEDVQLPEAEEEAAGGAGATAHPRAGPAETVLPPVSPRPGPPAQPTPGAPEQVTTAGRAAKPTGRPGAPATAKRRLTRGEVPTAAADWSWSGFEGARHRRFWSVHNSRGTKAFESRDAAKAYAKRAGGTVGAPLPQDIDFEKSGAAQPAAAVPEPRKNVVKTPEERPVVPSVKPGAPPVATRPPAKPSEPPYIPPGVGPPLASREPITPRTVKGAMDLQAPAKTSEPEIQEEKRGPRERARKSLATVWNNERPSAADVLLREAYDADVAVAESEPLDTPLGREFNVHVIPKPRSGPSSWAATDGSNGPVVSIFISDPKHLVHEIAHALDQAKVFEPLKETIIRERAAVQAGGRRPAGMQIEEVIANVFDKVAKGGASQNFPETSAKMREIVDARIRPKVKYPVPQASRGAVEIIAESPGVRAANKKAERVRQADQAYKEASEEHRKAAVLFRAKQMDQEVYLGYRDAVKVAEAAWEAATANRYFRESDAKKIAVGVTAIKDEHGNVVRWVGGPKVLTGTQIKEPEPEKAYDLKTPEERRIHVLGDIIAKAIERVHGQPMLKESRRFEIADNLLYSIAYKTFGDVIDPSNEATRSVFRSLTGIRLPSTIEGSRQVIETLPNEAIEQANRRIDGWVQDKEAGREPVQHIAEKAAEKAPSPRKQGIIEQEATRGTEQVQPSRPEPGAAERPVREADRGAGGAADDVSRRGGAELPQGPGAERVPEPGGKGGAAEVRPEPARSDKGADAGGYGPGGEARGGAGTGAREPAKVQRTGAERVQRRGGTPGERAGGEPDRTVEGIEPERGEGLDVDDASAETTDREHIETGTPQRDYVIRSDDPLFTAGPKTAARGNIEAIRVVKKLIEEQRPATPDEQRKLVLYTGWGSLKQAFDFTNADWKDIREELRRVLTEDEWEAANRSTVNAHYTPPAVINAMYQALEQLGFEGGKVLEPAVGVGHFFGLMPERMVRRSSRIGIELDLISGTIAQNLYQKAAVRLSPFQDAALPNGYFDLVISNVPFGSYYVKDQRYPKFLRQQIHDYYFARSIDLVRPGGVVAFVTSQGTLDKQGSEVRKYLADRADLVTAIRLNNSSLPGTKVVADIIILRRRKEGETPTDVKWIKSVEHPKFQGHYLNEYFLDRTQNVLGELKPGSQYRRGEDATTLTVDPIPGERWEDKLPDLLQQVPRDLLREALPEEVAEQELPVTAEGSTLPPGTYFERGGRIYASRGRQVPPVLADESITALKGGARNLARIKAMLRIRDAALAIYRMQGKAETGTEELDQAQAELNKAYAAAEKIEATPIRSATNRRVLIDDPYTYPVIEALEEEAVEAGKKTYTKGGIFTRKLQTVVHKQRTAETVRDGVPIVLDERNELDIPRLAEITGKSEQQVKDDLLAESLAFEETSGELVLATEYLAGNVRRKLADAIAAAELEPERFHRNVEALRVVQPKDKEAAQITVTIGAPWVPEDVLTAFAEHLFDVPLKITRLSGTGEWLLDTKSHEARQAGRTVAATATWGIPEYNGVDLLDDALHYKRPRVTMEVGDGHGGTRTVTDPVATAQAETKLDLMLEEFTRWIWQDNERLTRLVPIYNQTMNNIAQRQWDGSHLTFPGLNPLFQFRVYQKDGVYRIISAKGNTLVWVDVGGGKTAVYIGAAHELLRLGIARKPIIVVDNATPAQFMATARMMFPAANFTILEPDDVSPKNRKAALAKAAAAERTIFLCTQQTFTKIPVGTAVLEEYMGRQLAGLHASLSEAEGAEPRRGKKKQSSKVRRLNTQILNREARLAEKLEESKKDPSVTFEEIGFDWIFYDESQAVKNREYKTELEGVRGLGPPEGNQRTDDLAMKSEYVQRLQNGRGLVFGTGTPVSNSMTELYSLQRYLQPEVLREQGVASLDDWLRLFGTVSGKIEPMVGGDYGSVIRLRSFQNLKELVQQFLNMSFRTAKGVVGQAVAETNPIPLVSKNSAGERDYEIVTLPESPEHAAFQKDARRRVKAIKERHGPPEKGDDIMLSVLTDERHAAVDMRTIDTAAPEDPKGKLVTAARTIADIYRETTQERSTQLVFLNVSISSRESRKAGSWTAYDRLKELLIDRGVRADEIAFIHDYEGKKRPALYQAANEGRLRVVIGGVKKMGVGVNMQQRVVALHALDPPWTPDLLVQMEGRAIRSGNRNKEVRLFRYITKNSSDEFMFGLLLAKQRMMNQILTGESDQDTFEDIDLRAAAFEAAMGEATSKPVVREWVEASGNLAKLRAQNAAHTAEQLRLRQSEIQNRGILEAIEQKLPVAKAAAAEFASRKPPAVFRMTVQGQDYSKQGEAAVAMANANKTDNWVTIGEYGGVPVESRWEHVKGMGKQVLQKITVRLAPGVEGFESSGLGLLYEGQTVEDALKNVTPGGAYRLAQNLENTWFHAQQEVERLTKREAEVRKDLARAAETVGKPFAKAQELEELTLRTASLEKQVAELAKEAEQGEAAAAAEEADEDEEEGGGGTLPPATGPPENMMRHVTDEQRKWLRDHRRDDPAFGMGAMFNAPDPRNLWKRVYDAMVDKINGLPEGRLKRVVKYAGKQVYGSNVFANPEHIYRRFEQLRGGRAVAEEKANQFKARLNEALAPLDKPYVARVMFIAAAEGETNSYVKSLVAPVDAEGHEHWIDPEVKRLIETNGKIRVEDLPTSLQPVWYAAREFVHGVTNEMSQNTALHPYYAAFHLENFVQIMNERHAGEGFYMRHLFKPREAEARTRIKERRTGTRTAYETPEEVKARVRNVGPRIRAAMLKYRKSDELFTVQLANGNFRQYSDRDDAWEAYQQELDQNREQYGKSVEDRVKFIPPLGEESIREATPEDDPRVLLARTIVDGVMNLETLKLFHWLSETIARDQKEAEELGLTEDPNWVKLKDIATIGPLGGMWVPEPVAHNLMEVEKIRTGLNFWWDMYLYLWKFVKVIVSPTSWYNTTVGMFFPWSLDRLSPVTHVGFFRMAAEALRTRNGHYEALLREHELRANWATEDLDSMFEELRKAATGIAVPLVKWMEKLNAAGRSFGRYYNYLEDLSKLASYIRGITPEEYGGRGQTHEEAVRGLDVYTNYFRIGDFAKKSRKAWWGQPFISFTDNMVKVHIKAMRNAPGTLLAIYAFPGLLSLISKIIMGMDDDEEAALRAGQGKVEQYFKPFLPFRGADGRPMELNLLYIYPLMGELRLAMGAGGIGLPLLLGQPGVSQVIGAATNMSTVTGREITQEDDSVATKMYKHAAEFMAGAAPVPPIVSNHGLRLYRAAMGESDEDLNLLVLKTFFGITLSKPRASRSEVLRIVKERLSEQDAKSAEAILKYYNRVARARLEENAERLRARPKSEQQSYLRTRGPLSPDQVRQSIEGDRRREREAAAR